MTKKIRIDRGPRPPKPMISKRDGTGEWIQGWHLMSPEQQAIDTKRRKRQEYFLNKTSAKIPPGHFKATFMFTQSELEQDMTGVPLYIPMTIKREPEIEMSDQWQRVREQLRANVQQRMKQPEQRPSMDLSQLTTAGDTDAHTESQ